MSGRASHATSPRWNVCYICGSTLVERYYVCPHHIEVYGDNWAMGNKVMCDFFHRGVVPKRLPMTTRELGDYFAWGYEPMENYVATD